jgi:sporulation protein YlmC with PRC-barrel domain
MASPPQAPKAELDNLNDSDLILADPLEDIRGLKVFDKGGAEIGHVSDLFIDRTARKIRMLEVKAGGFLGLGERHFLLPVDAVTSVAKNEVHVNETLTRVEQAPPYDPKLLELPSRPDWEPFYGYYGVSPFWGNGYMYPSIPMERIEVPRAPAPSERDAKP